MGVSRLAGGLVLFLLLALVVASGCQTPAAQPTPAAAPPTAVPSKPTAVSQPTQSQGGAQVVKQYSAPPPMTIDPNKSYTVTLRTTKGDLKIEMLPKDAPNTVNNFVFLARDGYYSNVPFHRIMSGFMVQSGDPTGTGTGSPGYRFADEPVKRDYTRGIVAMANSGPNTNGSQFFIMHADYGLQKNYTIFGQVTDKASLDTLDKIAATPVKASSRGEKSVPTEDVRITSAEVAEK